MASNTVFKAERDNGYRDTDPLAELSRIMGLDRQTGDRPEDDIDLGLDLEQELLGDLAMDEALAQPATAQAPAAAAAPEALDDDFDDAFALMDAEVEASLGAVTPVDHAPVGEVDLHDFDRAFADLSFGDEPTRGAAPLASEDAPVAHAAVAEPVEAEWAPEPVEAEWTAEPVEAELIAEPVQAEWAAEPALDIDLDAEMQAFEEELGDLAIEPAFEAAPDVAVAPEVFDAEPAVPDAEGSDEVPVAFADDQDADWASEQSSLEKALMSEFDALSEVAAPEVEPIQDAPAMAAADEPASVAEVETVEAASVEPVAYEASVAAPSLSLEDELAMLLGDEALVAAAPVEEAYAPETEHEAAAADEWAVAAEPVAEAIESEADDDLSFTDADFGALADELAVIEPARDGGTDDVDHEVEAAAAVAATAIDAAELDAAFEELGDVPQAGEFADATPVEAVADDLPFEDDLADLASEFEALGDENWTEEVADEPVAVEPEMAAAGEDGQVETAFDPIELEEALMDTTPVEAPAPAAAPATRWPGFAAQRQEQKPEPEPAEPAVDDSDPFAALAALAAAPPILKTLSRSNPVALQPTAERPTTRSSWPQSTPVASPAPSVRPQPSEAPAAYRPAAPIAPPAPKPAAPVAATVSSPFQPRSLAERYAQRAAEPVAPAPVTPRPVAPQPVAATPVAPAPLVRAPLPQAPVAPAAPAHTSMPSGHYSSYPSFVPRPQPAAPQAVAQPVPQAQPAQQVQPAPAVARTPVAPVAPVAAPAAAPEPELDDFSELEALLDEELSPIVETFEVPDGPVALADDFHIPELAPEEPAPLPPEFDEFEAEFAATFAQPAQEPQRRWQSRSNDRVATAPAYSRPETTPTQGHAQPQPAMADFDLDASLEASLDNFDSTAFADDDAYAVGQGMVDDGRYQDELLDREEPKSRRGLLIAGVVAAVAIVGGIGTYAMFGGGGDADGTPALVRADPGPVKVKPENPGGVVVPNQDGTVYERVAGKAPSAPSQEKLIAGSEEPIEPTVATPAPVAAAPEAALPGVNAPGVKAEDRVVPDEVAAAPQATEENAAIAPKRVRTMIVRPDGTLVAREDTPAPAAAAPVTPVVAGVPQADPLTVAAAQPAAQIPSAVTGAADDVSILPPADAADAPAAEAPADIDFVPMARPARTPAPQRTAAAPAAPTPEPVAQPAPAAQAAAPVELAGGPAAAAAGVWSVQIASQPTREGAQATYVDLARRYASILDGKGVNIVAAEVAGKGTMWRVRVPAASRNDANILCAKLKTAGGTCFVSQ